MSPIAFTVGVVMFTNAMRTHSLKEDTLLDMDAQVRAELLCFEPFSHAGFEKFNPGYHYYGENLAKGDDARVFATSLSVVTAWLNSPTHRENMLAERYQYIGVGRAVCKDGSNREVQFFGGF